MNKNEFIEKIHSGLIVSCQVKQTDPHYDENTVTNMAKAAIWGGASGLRLESPTDITNVRNLTDLPIIGLWKNYRDNSEVFITWSMEQVTKVVEAGIDVIAVDATNRLNPEGKKAFEIIREIKKKYPDLLVLADIRDDSDVDTAIEYGADFIAPTLYRFSPIAKSDSEPDFEMLTKIVRKVNGRCEVIMEGKITTPEQAVLSLYYGAIAVVVGNAITRPHIVTRKFVDTIKGFPEKRSLYY